MPNLEEWFTSVETDRPFETCKVCKQLLPLAADTWVVSKHYHRGECIMEYAVCESCRDTIANRLSDSSKELIRDFMENHIDWEQRILDWLELEHAEQRLDLCVLCRTERDFMDGFAITAQFNNHGEIIHGALPLLMCTKCSSQMTDTLSPESKQVWQNFIDEHFEGPDFGNISFGPF